MQCSEQNMGMNISGILILAYYTYHVLYHVIYTLDYIQCILCVQTCVHIYIFFVRAYIYKYMHANIKLAMYVCACICIYILKIYVYVYQCCCSQYCTQHVTYFLHIHQHICIYTYTRMLYCIQHTNTCSITYMCIYIYIYICTMCVYIFIIVLITIYTRLIHMDTHCPRSNEFHVGFPKGLDSMNSVGPCHWTLNDLGITCNKQLETPHFCFVNKHFYT